MKTEKTFSQLLLLILLEVSLVSIECDSDIQTSTFEVQKLFHLEIQLYLSAFKILNGNKTKFAKVQSYFSQYYRPDEFFKGLDTIPNNEVLENYVSHPLNCLGIFKRTSFDIYELREVLDGDQELTDVFSDVMKLTEKFPSVYDYQEICSSISLLQEAYDLNSTDIADGIIRIRGKPSLKSSYNITWIELYHIGSSAGNKGWHASAHDWLTLALKRCDDKSNPNYSHAQEQYLNNIKIHDQLLEIKGFRKDGLKTFRVPIDENLRRKKKYQKILKKYPSMIRIKSKNYQPLFRPLEGPWLQTARDNFHSLCKDGEEGWRSSEDDKDLRCRFLTRDDPFLRLGPFKMEEKNKDPLVVLFPDFMTNRETNHFKVYAKKGMERSQVGAGRRQQTAKIRTSQQTWLFEKSHRFPLRSDGYVGVDGNGTFFLDTLTDLNYPINHPAKPNRYLQILDKIGFDVQTRMALATRLNLDRPFASEAFQIVNYGVGGQYAPHVDPKGYYLGKDRTHQFDSEGERRYYELTGDRMATFLVYLTTVDLGGATVFPSLGLRSEAIRGQAIFWINNQRTGPPNHLTLHGGCPVLVGSKWVTNKWIKYHDQMFNFPCGLQEPDFQLIR